MKDKSLNIAFFVAGTLGCIVFLILACLILGQHEAVVHHAAHFESNAWGVTTFYWNDEYPQVLNPEDNLEPPPLKK